MTQNIFKFTYIAFLIFSVLIIAGELIGHITFGYGLGDLFYLGMLILAIIFFSILRFFLGKMEGFEILFSILMIAVIIFFTLKFTILRGVEYSWNGEIFCNEHRSH
jgi:hypothetical protein